MPVSIRLDAEIEHRLDALTRATGQTKASFIREAIEEHLQDMEDAYLAQAELEAVRAGHSETVPLAMLLKHYNTDQAQKWR